MSNKRKKKGGDEENVERWLLTYSDMITLLMAFFIMMYSMSVISLSKFQRVAASIRSSFGNKVADGGTSVMQSSAGKTVMNPAGGNSIVPSILPNSNPLIPGKVANQIRQYIKQNHLENVLRVQETQRGLVVSMLTDKVMFQKGRADLTPEAIRLLNTVAGLIAKTNSHIRVEGNTDNLPINTERFPSNWELSTARASIVVRHLIEKCGIAPDRLSAAGYADSRPVYPNDTEYHRRLNRRVDLVILRGSESLPQ